jgi:hypothetical protein
VLSISNSVVDVMLPNFIKVMFKGKVGSVQEKERIAPLLYFHGCS